MLVMGDAHVKRGAAALASLLLPSAASAHLVGPMEDKSSLDIWQIDPIAIVLLALTAYLYWRGSRILGKRKLADRARFNRQRRYFWLGWSTLALALASPIDPLGELLFSVHMVQHELMMIVAGPLLVLSRPTSALLLGLGKTTARPVVGATRNLGLSRARQLLLGPTSAWTIHALGLWGWHIPFLFNAGLQSTWVHTAQHFSFLLIALIFWYSLLHIQRSQSVIGMLYLFTTAMHASLLGALLTFSPKVWYQPYVDTAPRFGLSALQDQQLGGLIMWMPAGVVFIAGALLFLARLLRHSKTDDYAPSTYHD